MLLDICPLALAFIGAAPPFFPPAPALSSPAHPFLPSPYLDLSVSFHAFSIMS